MAARVTLAQLAGVRAGLAEELPLADVVTNEGLDVSLWEPARDAWSKKIAIDRALQRRFDAEIALAEDRYPRAVTPFDEDQQAWLDLLRRWSREIDPLSFLRSLSLRPSDVRRLQRSWAKRMDKDVGVKSRAAAILAAPEQAIARPRPGRTVMLPPSAPTADMPFVEVEGEDALDDGGGTLVAQSPIVQREVLPFVSASRPKSMFEQTGPAASSPAPPPLPFRPGGSPLASGKSVRTPPPPAALTETAPGGPPPMQTPLPFSSPLPSLTVQQYASLCAELEVMPAREADVLARYRLTLAARAALEATWQQRLANHAEERAAFESARATYRAWLLSQRR